MSSSSIALAAWFNILSAALTFVDGGVAGSSMTLTRVETAALEPCCKRATDCRKATRRVSRYAASNAESFNHRWKVLTLTSAVRAACSIFWLRQECQNRLFLFGREICAESCH